jgi:hypothetical protein
MSCQTVRSGILLGNIKKPAPVARQKPALSSMRVGHKPSSVKDDHLSGMTVAGHLKRPTREVSEQPHPSPIRSCCGWGLPSRPVTWPLVRSYRTVSSLPRQPGRFVFCGTFLRIAPTGRYPAPCSVQLGLSSGSAFRTAARDRLANSQNGL